jgi:hypothetical protein
MPIDPFLITTVVFGVSTVALAAALDASKRRTKFYIGYSNDLKNQLWFRDQALERHEAAARKLAEQRRSAAAKGTAASAAKARALKAQDDFERPMRAAKTIEALRATPMRSREAVVAGVKAARTRKQQSGAGAAA